MFYIFYVTDLLRYGWPTVRATVVGTFEVWRAAAMSRWLPPLL